MPCAIWGNSSVDLMVSVAFKLLVDELGGGCGMANVENVRIRQLAAFCVT